MTLVLAVAAVLAVASQGRTFDGAPTVGALFAVTDSGVMGSHFCSASVVDSPSGNLVVTAAHCVRGRAAGQFVFVPAYHDGLAPYGTWTVDRVITDRHWQSASDPDDDFAFLEVSQPGTRARVEDLTGGERLGIGAPPRQVVAAIAYPDSGDAPIRCLNHTLPFGSAQLEFDCGGYTDGTSGGPLLADVSPATGRGTIVGVIGGYEQGGETAAVSYAARFGASAEALYRLATTGS
jgi:Trypsin